MPKKHLICVHGMYWKTCSQCGDKTKNEVLKELKEMDIKEKKIKYDYLQVEDTEVEEKDTDYDIEV